MDEQKNVPEETKPQEVEAPKKNTHHVLDPQEVPEPASPDEIAAAVWTQLGASLAPTKDMTDKEMLKNKLRNERRHCLAQIMERMIHQEELTFAMTTALKEKDERNIEACQKDIMNVKKGIRAWKMRLEAVDKVERDGEALKLAE